MRISKKWYASKTLWVNVLAILGMATQEYFGEDIISTELQVLMLPVINVVLRLITDSKIEW